MPQLPWTFAETEKLKQLLADNIGADWFVISNKLGTVRTPGACRKQAGLMLLPFRHARRRTDSPTDSPTDEVKRASLFAVAPDTRTEFDRVFGSLLAAERARGRRDVIEAVRGLLLKFTTED